MPLPSDADELTRIIADIHLLAVYANEAASRHVPHRSTPPTEALASREAECLRWTMEGKTAWEIGVILGIAESTVVSISAMRREGWAASTSSKQLPRRCGSASYVEPPRAETLSC